MNTLTIAQLNAAPKSKAEHFAPLQKAGSTFDYNLPQDWLNRVTEFAWERSSGEFKHLGIDSKNNLYDLIRSTTVWAYPAMYHTGKPVTVSREVELIIRRYYEVTTQGGYKWTNEERGA